MHIQHPWQPYTRPYVKDLAYALACPSALLEFPSQFKQLADSKCISLPSDDFWQAHFARYMPRLKQLEENPKPLNRFLSNHLVSGRLGFRFEALLLYWLQDTACHEFELIGYSVPIYESAQTIGEVDFIVKNTLTGEIEHWEVALKHYLAHLPFMAKDFIGLSEKDTLERKLTHMLGKQFRYESVNVDGVNYNIDKRRAIIKGRFFLPANSSQTLTQDALPCWLNLNLPFGIWKENFHDLGHSKSDLGDAACKKQDKATWRRAHRIEWLTKRDFLDAFELSMHEKQLNSEIARFSGRRVPLQLGRGLYFSLEPSNNLPNSKKSVDNTWLVIKYKTTKQAIK